MLCSFMCVRVEDVFMCTYVLCVCVWGGVRGGLGLYILWEEPEVIVGVVSVPSCEIYTLDFL